MDFIDDYLQSDEAYDDYYQDITDSDILEGSVHQHPEEISTFLNHSDYNLNSPLIRDGSDALFLYLTQGQEVRFYYQESWVSLKRKLNGLNDWLPTDENHKFFGRLMNQIPTPGLNINRLVTMTNRDCNMIQDIPNVYFEFLYKRKHRENYGKFIPSIPCTRFGEIFLQAHFIILVMNATTFPELQELAKTVKCRFKKSTNPRQTIKMIYLDLFGHVMIFENFVLLVDHHLILDRNFCLMVKDTAIARFNTLMSMSNRLDNRYSAQDQADILEIYEYGDQALMSHGSEAYKLIKLLEPICIHELAQRANTFRPLITIPNKFGRHINASLNNLGPLFPLGSAIQNVVNKMTSIHSVLVAYSSFRHWGHPYIDYIAGLEKLHTQVNMTKDIDTDYAGKLASDLAYMVLKNHYKKKKEWSVHVSQVPSNHVLYENIKTNTWPTAGKIRDVKDQWHLLPLKKCFDIPDVIDPATIYSDKSHSMQKREVLDHVRLNKPGFIPSEKVMKTYLSRKQTDWKSFLKKVDEEGLEEEDLIIGLKGKERELKEAGRFFALMSWNLREYFVMTELLIKKHFVPLFSGLTMADDMTEVIKKMLDSSNGQGLLDYQSVCLANHVDYEKWNNHQRLESTYPVFRVMGQFLGYPNLISRTHEFFEKSLIYYNERPDLMTVVNGQMRNVSSTRVCWNGQKGGLEGLRQKGWSIENLLVIRRESKIRSTVVKVLAQGDNQVICTQYKPPPGAEGEQLKEALDGLVRNNQVVMDSIEAGTKKLGLTINQDETVQSADFLTYGKIPIFRGNLMGLETKRYSRVACITNDQVPTLGNIIGSVATNCLTVAHSDTDSKEPIRQYVWFGSMVRNLIEFHNPSLRRPMKEVTNLRNQAGYFASVLFLDPSLGGICGTSLSRFLIRGFPDPLTEGLAFWKVVHDQIENPELARTIRKFGSPKIQNFEVSHIDKLVESPTSLNIKRGLSPTSLIKEEIKKTFFERVDTIKNELVRDAVYYSKTEEGPMRIFLLGMKPVFPRLLAEFRAATFIGVTDSVVGLFQNSRTIRTAFTRQAGNAIDKVIYKSELSSISNLTSTVESSEDPPIWQCSSSLADELRRKSWGSDIVGMTIPHPLELLGISTWERGDCLRCRDGSRRSHLTSIIVQGFNREMEIRGPLPAYLGSKTSESTSLVQPWEREAIIPLLKRADRLRNIISWFVKKDSNLAKSILSILKGMTGEDWSNQIEGFSRTGSAIHRFQSSRQGSGGYAATSPAFLTWSHTTTDTFSDLNDKNYDFMFQSLILYSQQVSISLAKEYETDQVFHSHIRCPECVREIPTIEVDSQSVFHHPDVTRQISRWIPEGGESFKTRNLGGVQVGRWDKINDREKSYHIGRAIAFVYGDSISTGSSVAHDGTLFPISIRSHLHLRAFFEGMMDGLIRAASVGVLHRRSTLEGHKPYTASLGSLYYLLDKLCEETTFQTFCRYSQTMSLFGTSPHRVPPSYPLNKGDLKVLAKSYLLWTIHSLLENILRQGYVSEYKSVWIFADINTPVLMGPLILSTEASRLAFRWSWNQKHKNRITILKDRISLLRINNENPPFSKNHNTWRCELEIRMAARQIVLLADNALDHDPSRDQTWGKEAFGSVESFLIDMTQDLFQESTEPVPRKSCPLISGLRLGQLATGAHYKIRSLIKHFRIRYRDFICGGDGSGGITSALLRLNQHSRCIFNSLIQYEGVILRGSSPAPPSAIEMLGRDKERCVNLNTCWAQPSDLCLGRTWKGLAAEKTTHHLRVNLMVFDMEVTNQRDIDRIQSNIQEHLGDLLDNGGGVIWKTYVSQLMRRESIIRRIGEDFRRLHICVSDFTSSHSSEVYVYFEFYDPGAHATYSPDHAQVMTACLKTKIYADDKEEFNRAWKVFQMNTLSGIPVNLIPSWEHELAGLLAHSGVVSGVASYMASVLAKYNPTGGLSIGTTIIILISNATFNSSCLSDISPSPPSDQTCIKWMCAIMGFLYWSVMITNNLKLYKTINILNNNIFPLTWGKSVIKAKGKKEPRFRSVCSPDKLPINKSQPLKSKQALIGSWIRLYRRLGPCQEGSANMDDIDLLVKTSNEGLSWKNSIQWWSLGKYLAGQIPLDVTRCKGRFRQKIDISGSWRD